MKQSSMIGLIGLLVLSVGVVSQFAGGQLSTVSAVCGTWTTGNPASSSPTSPTSFPTGQAEQLSATFTLGSNCVINTSFGVGVGAFCTSNCGSAGTGPALTGCNNCAGGTFAPSSISSSGAISFVWGTGSGGSIAIGAGSYPSGATVTVQFSLSACQSGSCTTNVLSVFSAFSSGVSGSAFDFTFAASPTSLSLGGSQTASSTLTVTPLNGYPGPTQFSAACSSTTLTPCNLSVSSIGASGTTVLTVGGNTAGTYSATVTATYSSGSGNLVHSVTIQIVVQSSSGSTTPDFTMTIPSSVIIFPVGGSGTASITLAALNGFAGTVNVATVVGTNNGAGTATCSVSPSSGTLGSSTTSVSLTLTMGATSAGTFQCAVTGTSGSTSHTLSVFGQFGTGSSSCTSSSITCQATSCTSTTTFPQYSTGGVLTCSIINLGLFSLSLSQLFIALGAVAIIIAVRPSGKKTKVG